MDVLPGLLLSKDSRCTASQYEETHVHWRDANVMAIQRLVDACVTTCQPNDGVGPVC